MKQEMIELLMDVHKEIRCAEKYAHESAKHRKEFPELSQTYHRIAMEKLIHADLLNTQAEIMADKANMEAVWEVEEVLIESDMERVRKCLNEQHK